MRKYEDLIEAVRELAPDGRDQESVKAALQLILDKCELDIVLTAEREFLPVNPGLLSTAAIELCDDFPF